MPQPICDAGDRRINLQSLHEQRIAHPENRARIKMRVPVARLKAFRQRLRDYGLNGC